ncbi:hypothetical protein SUDANB15_07441 (plasmid) [Streptomyces sp. enrichment culture]|uniref:hypothetical protein n=1 Tax=Streptomyces sp. enrichment culture TaxID=1795815 RepID=UPI003F55EC97
MTGRRPTPITLPAPSPLGTIGDALHDARTCVCAPHLRLPVRLGQLAAVLVHVFGPGPFEARPGQASILLAPHGGPQLSAGAHAGSLPTGRYRYDPAAYRLVPENGETACPQDAGIALRLTAHSILDATAARIRLVAAASGLCVHEAPDGDLATILLRGARAGARPARRGVSVEEALATLAAAPPDHEAAPSAAPTRQDLTALLRAADLRTPYRVTVRRVEGMEPGVYQPGTGGTLPAAVWTGPTNHLAHLLTWGGHETAAALAGAPAVVHLVGGPQTAAEVLRLRVAAVDLGLGTWCDDHPAPSAAALLGLTAGEDVICNVTVGRARPEPRLRVPVPFPALRVPGASS